MSLSTHSSDVLFDAEAVYGDDPMDRGESDEFDSHTASSRRSSHPDNAHPRYVPPHQRRYKKETGDEFAFPATEKKGDEQGVEARHFARLIIYISYALTKAVIAALHLRFPGVHFHSTDVTNHDHPVAHAVTVVGTTFLQRMIKAGSQVLDVYGNPNACDRFNGIQSRRNNPKFAVPLVNNFGGADFIREINKWGPTHDGEGNQRFEEGTISEVARRDPTFFSRFSIFQCIHTLYYLTNANIETMLSASPRSKILALVHTHVNQHGFINSGEQEYWVKGSMVKQVNTKTKTAYYHPNITPKFFSEKKSCKTQSGFEYVWECHFVCEDTWIIEIAQARPVSFATSKAMDYQAMWEAAEAAEDGRKASKLTFDEPPPNILPTSDGKFIELRAENEELVGKLRTQAVGRSRVGKEGQKLMLDLISLAKHLTDPSAIFEGAQGLQVDRATLADHVVKAFISDVPRELALMDAVDMLSPLLKAHAAKKVGPKLAKGMAPLALMQNFRLAVQGGIVANRVARHKDPIGAGLQALDEALDDKVWGI